MRLSFECDDALAALSRTLDQLRRLDIRLQNLTATASAPGCTVSMELDAVDPGIAKTLCDRIAQIVGVTSLHWDVERPRIVQAELIS